MPVGGQERVGQLFRPGVLTDQGIDHQRPDHGLPAARQGGFDGEALVGLAVGYQSGHVRWEGPLG